MSETRIPVETPRARIGDLARLPVFLALAGKRALVAGGSAAAAWKVELLAAAGAEVKVVAEKFSGEMLAAAADAARGTVELELRAWAASDFVGNAVAVGACHDDDEAARFAGAARAAGVPVNVIDRPPFCDFAFGSIVNRSPLVIGISTDGAAPVFAQAVRANLEAMLPRGFADWAAAAARWRDTVKTSGLSFAARRKFWQLFTAHAVNHPNDAPAQATFDRLLAETEGARDAAECGSVTLVGAGPGDPELLTLRAVRAMQSADVILFDDLVSAEILDFARREAKKMLVGKTGHGAACKQDDINRLMVDLAATGRRVVRLKGGDPMIFGRAGEEIAACRAAGIAVEVVPGITAAQGAAAALHLPLTDRGLSRRLQYITGHGRDGALPADIDWAGIADPATTTAIYMPVMTLAALVKKAVAAGLDPDTPAIAVARASRPDQRVIVERVIDLPRRLASGGLPNPVLVMIGRALAEKVVVPEAGYAAGAPCALASRSTTGIWASS